LTAGALKIVNKMSPFAKKQGPLVVHFCICASTYVMYWYLYTYIPTYLWQSTPTLENWHSAFAQFLFEWKKHLTGRQKSYDWHVAPWHTFCHSNAKNKINKLFSIKNTSKGKYLTIGKKWNRWSKPDNCAAHKKIFPTKPENKKHSVIIG